MPSNQSDHSLESFELVRIGFNATGHSREFVVFDEVKGNLVVLECHNGIYRLIELIDI